MEENLKQISQFVTSDLCIYEMQAIDYPNLIQQQFINSYATMRSIMENDHSTITRNLFNYAQKSLQTISQGFIYYVMVEPNEVQKLLRHLMVLKVQVWQSICQNLQILLKDSTYSIKHKYRLCYGQILEQLMIYRTASIQVCVLLIKSIQTYEPTQPNIEVSKMLLNKFYTLLKEERDIPSPLMLVFYHFLFLKCIKLLSMKCRDLQQLCLLIVQLLWKKNKDQCRRPKSQIAITLMQFGHTQVGVIQQIQQQLKEGQQNYEIRCGLFSVLIPLKIQNSLIQILNEPFDRNKIKIFLNWMHKQTIQSFQYSIKIKLYGDIGRLMVLEQRNPQARMHILFWLVKVVLGMGQNQAFLRLRWVIFYEWTDNQQPFSALISSIQFLKLILSYEPKIAQDFLIYLIKMLNQTNQQRLRSILWQAHSQKILTISSITNSITIGKAVKDEVIKIMGNFEQPQSKSIQFNPEQDIEENEQQINYDEPIAQQLSHNQSIKKSQYKLEVDENFALQIQNQLLLVLQEPTLGRYRQFLAKVWKVGLTIIKQKLNIQSFIEETAKITYVLFNHEFQDFQTQNKLQESVVHFLIKYIVDQWKRVTNKLQITKKVIKRLIELFPITQIVFWKHFLLNFKLGGANNRDVKNWLFPKEKLSNVVWMIQEMSEKVNQTIRSNAVSYRIQVP